MSAAGPSIILDTAVWRSTHLLRSSIGPAFLFWADNNGVTIIIPSAVRRELSKGILQAFEVAYARCEKALEEIAQLVGEGVFPPIGKLKESDMDRAITQRLEELGSLCRQWDADQAFVTRAGERVFEKKRPASPDHENFKDCVIWEEIMASESDGTLHLVSPDKRAFWDNANTSLHPDLAKEAEGRGLQVRIWENPSEVLKNLSVEPPYSKDEVRRALIGLIDPAAIMEGAVIAQGDPTDIESSVRAFYVEKHDRLFIEFKLGFRYESAVITDEPAGPTILEVSGSGYWVAKDKAVDDLQVLTLQAVDAEGGHPRAAIFNVVPAENRIGFRAPYRFRRPLDRED